MYQDSWGRRWRARLWALLAQPVKLPGWATILLAIYTFVPDNLSRTHWWLDVAKSTGGYVAVAATVVESPYFGLGLLIAGLLWILFVGEPTKGVQRHHWLRYVGWSVFSVCLAAVIITIHTGYVELSLRIAYDQGKAGLPRNTPDVGNPTRPQAPIYTGNYELTPDQIRIFLQEFPRLLQSIPIFYIARMPGDVTSNQLFMQFDQTLRRSGFANIQGESQTPRDPSEEGVMISVHDPNNIPVAAQRFREILEVANIQPKVVSITKGASPDIQFILFLGPRPIQWR